MIKNLRLAQHYVLGGKNKSLILVPIIMFISLIEGFIILDNINQILNGIIFVIFMCITLYGIFIEAPAEMREAQELFNYLKENATEIKSKEVKMSKEDIKRRKKEEWLYIFNYKKILLDLNIKTLAKSIRYGFYRRRLNKKSIFIIGMIISLILLKRGEEGGMILYIFNSVGVILSIIEGKLLLEEYKFWEKLSEKISK